MALQHLRSNTASKRPTPASMADGQLAINTNATSPGVFFKDAGGALIKVGPVHVGTSAPNSSPAAGGSTGNSVGEQWLDTSGGSYVFKVWDGSAWRSEAGEFVDAAGDTMTGDLVMNNANIVFEGSTDDGFETTLTVVDPTADRTITLPNVTGTVVTTGDTGTVTSTMIADGTIVNADVNASAAIAGTKIDPDFGSQTIETTGVFSAAGGSAAAPSITFTGDTNTGIYSPGADQVALSTNGTGRLFVDANGNVGAGTAFPENYGGGFATLEARGLSGTAGGIFQTRSFDASVKGYFYVDSSANAGRIGTVTNHPFLFVTSSQERLRITSAGLVGIGTSSPSFGVGDGLEVARSGVATVRVSSNTQGVELRSDGGTGTLETRGAFPLLFGIQGTERARIDSSGRLLVGTSSARTDFSAGTIVQVESVGSGAARYASTSNNNLSADGAGFYFARSRGTSVGSNAIVLNGDTLGGLFFQGADGTDIASRAGEIKCEVDGTPGANDMPGRLVFSTTADGASSPAERMRIDSDGTMLLGVNTKIIGQTTNPYLFFQAQSNVTTAGMSIESYGNNTARRYHFAFTNPNGVVGTISTNGTATAYTTSSDYRLKENVTPVTDGITRLQQLKPSRFNFIADPTKTVDGFIAHEAGEVVPECVTGEKDAVDADGKPVYQGIDQSKLVPLLTAALQEAIGEIESLKARVAALESV